MRKRWISVSILAAALALAVGLWFVDGSDSRRHARAATRQTSSSNVWAQIAKAARQESRSADLRRWPFAEITRPLHGMPDLLKREAKEALAGPQSASLLFDSARFAITPTGGGLWVVSGRDVVCVLRAMTAAVACNTVAHVYRHGLVLEVYKRDKASGPPTSFTALGIMPDGVRSITAEVGRRQRRIKVSGMRFQPKRACRSTYCYLSD
jgi:hypothetical protein